MVTAKIKRQSENQSLSVWMRVFFTPSKGTWMGNWNEEIKETRDRLPPGERRGRDIQQDINRNKQP